MHSSQSIFAAVVLKARHTRFQTYQARRDAFMEERVSPNPRELRHIVHTDFAFHEQALPLCQEYVDCQVKETLEGYAFALPSTEELPREDISSPCSSTTYAMLRLGKLLVDFKEIEDKIFTDTDMDELVCICKAIEQHCK
ncbi:hypothetical protein F441_15147 [Phytophthora nicotianae CJ01A1]|nr:hypothetical protein L915_14880 [Phytophthora nicotianae]ETP08952.1 hypothetical protein F441_15147 [Phytophthora nicotianae CJ01A1]